MLGLGLVLLVTTTVLSAVLSSMLATMAAVARRHDRGPALEIDVHAASVLLSHVLQTELLADLLDAGLDLLDVVDGVVSLAHDTVKLLTTIDIEIHEYCSLFRKFGRAVNEG